MSDVVLRLFERLRGDAGEIGLGIALQCVPLVQREDTEEELPHDGDGEISLRQLDQ